YYPICNRTIVAMSGGGKTAGITIPALLTENRPVFVHDPKGELFAVTAKHRIEKFGREIILFDPFGVTLKSDVAVKAHSINPFSYFPTGNINFKDRFITSLTSALVNNEGSPRYGSHFEDTAKIIIAGIIDLLLLHGKSSFLNLYSIISEGPQKIEKRIHTYMTDNSISVDLLSPHLKEAYSLLEATGKDESGSIFTTTLRQLRWMSDSNLRGLFQKDTCDLRYFISGKADIFIVLPEDQIKEQSRVVKLILSLVASLLIQTEKPFLSSKEYLFLLDELGQLGYNEQLENYIEILRARNCVFWSVFQTYSQIKLYQKPDLFINSKMLQLFSCSDPDIMQLIQKLGGTKTVLLETHSSSDSNNQQKMEILKGSLSESTGSSHHEVSTDLIKLNDIREMPFDEQLVFIQGLQPIRCRKTLYFKEKSLLDLCGKNPIEDSGKGR
ncbi:MAG: type IV secretory system conjugative DNA transfer family protein, partial [Lentisphaerota bacterium]